MSLGTITPVIFWIALIIVALIAEIITVGLTCIWFAGGGVVAVIAAAAGAPLWLQIVLFFSVSFLLLFATRPFVIKYINPKKIKTNYEDAVGKKVRVTERVDNITETGTAILNGQEWTARMESDETSLEPDEMGEVVRIEGVKLILKA